MATLWNRVFNASITQYQWADTCLEMEKEKWRTKRRVTTAKILRVRLQNPVSFRFVTGHSLLGGIFCVTKETTISASPCFPSVIWVPLRARVHHSSLPGITQTILFAKQNRQGKKGCYMTNFASTRSEETVVVCTQQRNWSSPISYDSKDLLDFSFTLTLHSVLLHQSARAGRVP